MQNCLRKKTEICTQSQITNSYRKKISENSHKELISLSLKGSWDLTSTKAGHQTKATGPRHTTSQPQAGSEEPGKKLAHHERLFLTNQLGKIQKVWLILVTQACAPSYSETPAEAGGLKFQNFKASRATEQAQGPAWPT